MKKSNFNLSPQLILILLVAVAAVASGVYSTVRNRQPDATTTTAGAQLATTDATPIPSTMDTSLSQPVEGALEAARDGDLDKYLSYFTDPLRTQLTQMRQQKGDAYLRDYLAKLTKPVKGVAVDLTKKEEVGPDEVRLPVEFVYQERNEVQPFVLRHENTAWRISKIESVRSAPVLIPYGTVLQEVKELPRK